MSDDHHPHHPCCGVSTNPGDYFLTRRQFLNRTGMGLGALGLATLLDPLHLVGAPADAKTVVANPLAPRAPQFPGKAKAVIHIFAQGAPSHVDTWDPKPMLTRMNNQTIGGDGVAMASPATCLPPASTASVACVQKSVNSPPGRRVEASVAETCPPARRL